MYQRVQLVRIFLKSRESPKCCFSRGRCACSKARQLPAGPRAVLLDVLGVQQQVGSVGCAAGTCLTCAVLRRRRRSVAVYTAAAEGSFDMRHNSGFANFV